MWVAKSCGSGQLVAVKVLEISNDILEEIEEEYCILTEHGGRHDHLPHFYGAYVKTDSQADQILVCHGGTF